MRYRSEIFMRVIRCVNIRSLTQEHTKKKVAAAATTRPIKWTYNTEKKCANRAHCTQIHKFLFDLDKCTIFMLPCTLLPICPFICSSLRFAQNMRLRIVILCKHTRCTLLSGIRRCTDIYWPTVQRNLSLSLFVSVWICSSLSLCECLCSSDIYICAHKTHFGPLNYWL